MSNDNVGPNTQRQLEDEMIAAMTKSEGLIEARFIELSMELATKGSLSDGKMDLLLKMRSAKASLLLVQKIDRFISHVTTGRPAASPLIIPGGRG